MAVWISLFYMKNGKKPDNIAAQARRPAFSAFAVTVHDKARETRAESALDAKIRCIIRFTFNKPDGAFILSICVAGHIFASRSCMGDTKKISTSGGKQL